MQRIFSQWISLMLIAAGGSVLPAQHAAAQSEMSGLASVSGTVASSSPFQAAKVYFRNTDKRIQYMVYTAGGKYQAMHLFPGNYEMRVEARGYVSPVTTVVLKPGANV